VAKIGWTIAAVVGVIVFLIVVDVVRSFSKLHEELNAQKLIAASEVQLDDLDLTGSAPNYQLRGVVRNHSSKYTLTRVLLGFVVEGCVNGDCKRQAQGHAELGCELRPDQSARFSTPIVQVEREAPAAGESRLTYRVYLTIARR